MWPTTFMLLKKKFFTLKNGFELPLEKLLSGKAAVGFLWPAENKVHCGW
jgi:hypothetical protein